MAIWASSPQKREQMVLFVERLDDAIPPNHTVRLLDEILGEIDWSAFEQQYANQRGGQPAIHPRVLAAVLLFGLLTRIRSSRALEEALLVRLDFRWLAQGHTIDHSTLSEFRRKHPDLLKQLFLQICRLAQSLGFLGLQRLAFDGTRIKANNRRTGTRTPEQLREELQELEQKFEGSEQQAAAADARDEELLGSQTSHAVPAELADAQRRREQLRKTLAALDAAKQCGDKLPARVPTTDLDARVMPNKDGGFAPNYTPTATVDVASGFIVGVDVLNQINEDSQLPHAIREVQKDFALPAPPPEMLADGLMGTGANLAELNAMGVTLYSPCELPDASNPALRADPTQPVPEAEWQRLPMNKIAGRTEGQLDKSAFVYDAANNCYWCPWGQPLTHQKTTSEETASGRVHRERYFADGAACAACPLRSRCLQNASAGTLEVTAETSETPSAPTKETPSKKAQTKKTPSKGRSINRDRNEAHREQLAERMSQPESQKIYGERRHAGERPFAMIKQQFGIRQFLLRGLEQVKCEWYLGAMAFNLTIFMSLMRSRAGPV